MTQMQENKEVLERYLSRVFKDTFNRVSIELADQWSTPPTYEYWAHFDRLLTDDERKFLPVKCRGAHVIGSSPAPEEGPNRIWGFGGTGKLEI